MSGFTKGPWSLAIHSSSGLAYGIKGRHGPEKVNVVNWGGISRASSSTGQANARLIAAAPELYEALVKAEGHLAAIGTPRDSMGRYHKDGEWTFNEAVPREVDAAEVSVAFAVIRAAISKAAGEGV